MDIILSQTEVWQTAVSQLLFCFFVILGLVLFWRNKKPFWFVLSVSVFSALAYLILIYQAKVTWLGLIGDELFITAFLQKVAAGQFFVDYFYSNLPPFYPPLYFWLAGFFGFLFHFNGIQTAHLGIALVIFITPLLIYFGQRYYWSKDKKKIPPWHQALPAVMIFIVADWESIIFKPYEFISAVLICFWAIFLLRDLDQKSLTKQKIIFYGIVGGLIALTYYFWFFQIALVIVLFKLFSKTNFKYYYSRLFIIGCLIFLVTLPFTLPFFASYLIFGAETWQPYFFVLADLDYYLPFFSFSVFGLVAWLGLLSFIFYWRQVEIKVLAIIFFSAYLWQVMNAVIIFFFQTPFVPAKPFMFLSGTALVLALAFGITEVWEKLNLKSHKLKIILFFVGWTILATQLLFGSFAIKDSTRQRLVNIKKSIREEFINLIDELKKVKNISQLKILSSGVPQISAFLPLDYYISHNIHFSHPAANFSQRYYFIETLAKSRKPLEFYQKLKQAPFEKIDALLLLKGPDFYPVSFYLDNFPGGIEKEIRIPQTLINEQFFDKIFEDKHFVFYKVK